MARRPTRAPTITVDSPEDSADMILANMGEEIPKRVKTGDEQPLYRIYEKSRIPISKAVGRVWERKYEAACAAYEPVYLAWDEAFRYYNHNQTKDSLSPRGHFHRGDATENMVYSNVNTMIPAIYSKNPDITCTTEDGEDEDFCKTIQSLVNTLFRRKAAPGMNLKPRAKRAALLAELTNMGILKLEFTDKDDSRDKALEEMTFLKDELAEAEKRGDVDEIYGKLAALEAQAETSEPSGFKLSCLLPHNLMVDPYCENDDLTDAGWVMELGFLPTEYLNARFTKKGKGDLSEQRVLIYKPTHRAQFTAKGNGENDDGLGVIMEAMSGESSMPTAFTDEERLAYLYTYMTEVVWVWDRASRQVYLFLKNDWTWPIWVWDDPYHLTRFFPYFLIQYSMSTGGVTSPGVVSYYLDQQDEINDINRQVSRIRRRLFDFFYYNSNVIDKAEVEKFIRAMRANTQTGTEALGIKLDPSQKIDDVIQSVGIPSKDAEPFFDKGQAMQAIDRVSATTDAMRGNQFKTNTTEDAVQSYVDATRIRIGSKTDAIEDAISDVAVAVSEVSVQKLDKVAVEGLIGRKKAANWKQMSVEEFSATYSVVVVAGSIEKPTSVFKKKEAVQVAQAIGQFANAAPVSSMMIALRVLEKAFTEVVIHAEEWEMIQQEIMKNAGGQGQPGAGAASPEQAGGLDRATLENLPPEAKAAVVQMRRQGKSDEEILAFIKEAVTKGGGGDVTQPQPQPQESEYGPS